MHSNLLKARRKSHMELGSIYFWTATIHNWHKLLLDDAYKQVVIDALRYLSERKLIDLFAFVIMPNHIHLIWRMNKMNGRQSPHHSFLKHTAWVFKKKIEEEKPSHLQFFRIESSNKMHQFWRRDSLAIELYSAKFTYQKIDYLHKNPVAGKWRLASDYCAYKHSSASFYETGKTHFDFITDIRKEIY